MGNFFSKRKPRNCDNMELLLSSNTTDFYNNIQSTNDSISYVREKVFILEESTGTNIQLLSRDIHLLDNKIKALEEKVDETLQINRILAKKVQETDTKETIY